MPDLTECASILLNFVSDREVVSGTSVMELLEASTPDGRTPLFIAARNGSHAVLSLLVSRRALINTGKNDGWTVLHACAAGGHVDCMNLLLASGNTQANAVYGPPGRVFGWTPVIKAAGEGHEACVRMLAENGADVSATRADGATALHWASSRGQHSVVCLLVALGADRFAQLTEARFTPLHEAARGGHLATLVSLCKVL